MTLLQRVSGIAALCLLAACSRSPEATPAVQASAVHAAGAELSEERARKAGIEIATAAPARIRESLILYGAIRANGEREQDVRARYAGIVRTVNRRVGDSVTRGAELLTVESNDSLQVYPVKAPLSGQVLERRVNPGDTVESSTVLMKVADLSTVWAEFAIFSRDLRLVRTGQRVSIRGADSTVSAEGVIRYIAPAGQAGAQSVIARATLDNGPMPWIPGQFITGDLITADAQAAVAIRPEALQELQGKTVVFVHEGSGFTARAVRIGRRSPDAVEILEGLRAGERYAAANSYLIKADLLKSEAEED